MTPAINREEWLYNATTARRIGYVWLITVPGHVWPVTPDMPSARFNISHTPCKSFPGRAAALAEVARILKGN